MTRVLVVDDEIDTLNLLRVILEISGYEAFTTLNSVEAITLAEVEHPDCVLLDIMMPQLDGFTLCKMMRLHPATINLPIVFVTAYSALDLEERRLEAGADMVLPKPVGMDVLIEAIEKATAIRASKTVEMKPVDILSDIWLKTASAAADKKPQPDSSSPVPAPVSPVKDDKPQPFTSSPAPVPAFTTIDSRPQPDGGSPAPVPASPVKDDKPQPFSSGPTPVPAFTTTDAKRQPDGGSPAPVPVSPSVQNPPDSVVDPDAPKPTPTP